MDKNGDGFVDLQEYMGKFTSKIKQVSVGSFILLQKLKAQTQTRPLTVCLGDFSCTSAKVVLQMWVRSVP